MGVGKNPKKSGRRKKGKRKRDKLPPKHAKKRFKKGKKK